ncbi:unnamed protein product [Prorocentrum cordatum]|uniref:Solute carrier family 40 protein n=1 Tax=Prorocentrum cordatum TaxID=2364126 RepID=A0ABN9QSD3_9DINO|nr:unnamed protein product [Polarella glacialis]
MSAVGAMAQTKGQGDALALISTPARLRPKGQGEAIALLNKEPSGCAGKSGAQKEWPLWRLSLVALPCLSITVVWSVIMPCSAPYLVALGMSPASATLNNMAGPICGFFTCPLIGALSDSSTSSYGRRRPIIVAALGALWVCGLLFASSAALLPASAAAGFAACMLWLIDIALNALSTPMRVLVADLASSGQQVQVQVLVACFQAVGFLVGFSTMKVYGSDGGLSKHMLEIIVVVCCILTAAVAVMLCVAVEKPLAVDGAARQSSPVSDVLKAVRGSSLLLRRLAGVHCLVFVGATVWLSYSVQWFGLCVFAGDPLAPPGSAAHRSYASGQEAFAYGGQCGSLLKLLMSLLLVVALHRTSLPPKGVYAACIFVGAGVSYAAAFFVKQNADFATACMALSVLPCVGSQGIPWGLIAASNKAAEERGLPVSTALQMALLNCGLVLGQQFTHLTLAAMESFVAPTLALPAMLAAGAVAMTVAGAGALMLPSGAEEHDALGAGGRTGGADLELSPPTPRDGEGL